MQHVLETYTSLVGRAGQGAHREPFLAPEGPGDQGGEISGQQKGWEDPEGLASSWYHLSHTQCCANLPCWLGL